MMQLTSYLAGRWRRGEGDGTPLVNPTTEAPLARASTAGLDLGGALAHARARGGPALRAMTFAERGALLKALAEALQGGREALIAASIENGGTTRSDAKFDIDGAIFTLGHYARLGAGLGERRFLVDGEAERLARSPRWAGFHVRVPRRGAAVHVNAFNFPAWGLAEKAACALLAGMPVVTKPATATALLAHRCVELMVASGALPEGALQLVCGSPGDLLTHLDGQDALAFTGSADTAARLRALPNVVARSVPVNVEADSLNAALLGPDVAPEGETYAMFLRDVVREMTQKAGQKCTATRRILVPAALADRVEADLVERLAAVRVGDPADEATEMGPLATARQREDFRAGVAALVAAGARLVHGEGAGAAPLPERGFFVPPTLLRADRPAEAGAVHEREVFGPCATLCPYGDLDEAVRLVALGGGGLVVALYADDREVAGELILGLAPHHGRVFWGCEKTAAVASTPGTVIPSCVHGGPGRAGGGEELGGLRGLAFYTQRAAVQGDRGALERILGLRG